MNNSLKIFKILSEETRLRILNLFIKSKTNLCVCELMDALQLPQYAVSKAIIQIKKSGLLISNKKGTWVYYELDNSSKKNLLLIQFLDNLFSEKEYKDDLDRLNKRLKLRENQKCVVGIISKKNK